MVNVILILYFKGKGKATPVQAWTGPDVSRKLRSPGFRTVCT